MVKQSKANSKKNKTPDDSGHGDWIMAGSRPSKAAASERAMGYPAKHAERPALPPSAPPKSKRHKAETPSYGAKLASLLKDTDEPTISTIDEGEPALPTIEELPPLWGPNDPHGWIVYVRCAHKAIVAKRLLGGPPFASFDDGRFVAFAVQRDNIPDRESWEIIREAAFLVIDERSVIEDATLPGTLLLWPERVKQSKGWAPAQRWSVERPMAAITDYIRHLVPDCKLGIEVKHGKPALAVQVKGAGLATVLSRAKCDDLQVEVCTDSTMQSMFLEVTAEERKRITIPKLMLGLQNTISAKYPDVVWIPSEIQNGARSIALFTTDISVVESLAYTDKGVTVRFAPAADSTYSVAGNREANTRIADEAERTVARVLSVEAEELAKKDAEAAADGSMADDDEVPELVRVLTDKYIVERAEEVKKVCRKVLRMLTTCHLDDKERSKLMKALLDGLPSECDAADAYLQSIMNARGPADLLQIAGVTEAAIATTSTKTSTKTGAADVPAALPPVLNFSTLSKVPVASARSFAPQMVGHPHARVGAKKAPVATANTNRNSKLKWSADKQEVNRRRFLTAGARRSRR